MFVPYFFLIIGVLFLAGCGGTVHWDASLDSDELQGKRQAWFEENWGRPSAKAQRFFGEEAWIYFRIAGKKTLPVFNVGPSECQISLDFDKEGKIKNSGFSGC